MIKYKRSDCLSVLVSLKKKQHIRQLMFKGYELAFKQPELKDRPLFFSLGSLTCEFQTFYILLSVACILSFDFPFLI
ncbi:hypothetical protein BuS5_00368 [Desulfosarcina sp. BuS5]|nr:hypothetical protein BuS5_00368 [Desulfosarcina sp. BuS5]